MSIEPPNDIDEKVVTVTRETEWLELWSDNGNWNQRTSWAMKWQRALKPLSPLPIPDTEDLRTVSAAADNGQQRSILKNENSFFEVCKTPNTWSGAAEVNRLSASYFCAHGDQKFDWMV